MESPAIGPAQQPYPRVDPSKLIGTEMISVRAGLFRAKHYRYRTPYGERVDYWIDDSVAPIGLIKLEAEQKQHSGFRGGFKFELVAMGSGAIPQVTKPARPFDARDASQRQGLPWTRNARVGPQPPAKVDPVAAPAGARRSNIAACAARLVALSLVICLGGARVRAESARAAVAVGARPLLHARRRRQRLSGHARARWKSTRR